MAKPPGRTNEFEDLKRWLEVLTEDGVDGLELVHTFPTFGGSLESPPFDRKPTKESATMYDTDEPGSKRPAGTPAREHEPMQRLTDLAPPVRNGITGTRSRDGRSVEFICGPTNGSRGYDLLDGDE